MALHALAYCERLFYLEEVEEIRIADHRVYAGRTLHETELPAQAEQESVVLESEAWGIKGKVDFVRYRDGGLVAYEHKRGRSMGDDAWPSDRLQVIAYAVLLEEHLGKPVREGRVHYHANNKTVRVPVDDAAREALRAAVARARELSRSVQRPPVAENEKLCAKCSLAPVCLPEEERLLRAVDSGEEATQAPRLFPEDDERRILHVVEEGSRVSKSGEQIVVSPREDEPRKFPGRDVAAIVLHGSVQISSQAVHYAVAHDIAVHWLTGGGQYVAGLAPAGGVQRRIRQFEGLRQPELTLRLARRLVKAKIENQLRFLMRGSRGKDGDGKVVGVLKGIRAELRGVDRAVDVDALRGHEGMAGKLYFSALPALLDAGELMRFSGRNRRPPEDPFNAALSFGYSLLYRDAMAAIICVGLDPAFGFFHRPRSAAYPLALDLMELFRTVLWDMPLVASVNRNQWREEHFSRSAGRVWLSQDGRRLAIELYESRKQESWKHPVLDYSLSYARAMELEARLLEKEWSGSPGLFGNMRIRG
jgi:CRISP-associated protein Cas1